jgi:hypothetical protein
MKVLSIPVGQANWGGLSGIVSLLIGKHRLLPDKPARGRELYFVRATKDPFRGIPQKVESLEQGHTRDLAILADVGVSAAAVVAPFAAFSCPKLVYKPSR